MDLFGFGPKFDPYHYAELPSYKRVKWGRLTGPSHVLLFKFAHIKNLHYINVPKEPLVCWRVCENLGKPTMGNRELTFNFEKRTLDHGDFTMILTLDGVKKAMDYSIRVFLFVSQERHALYISQSNCIYSC